MAVSVRTMDGQNGYKNSDNARSNLLALQHDLQLCDMILQTSPRVHEGLGWRNLKTSAANAKSSQCLPLGECAVFKTPARDDSLRNQRSTVFPKGWAIAACCHSGHIILCAIERRLHREVWPWQLAVGLADSISLLALAGLDRALRLVS